MLALSWLIHTCRLWRERTRHRLLLARLLRRERCCTSHRLLHWLTLWINLWRELLLHMLLVLGLLCHLLLSCTLDLPAVNGVEVTAITTLLTGNVKMCGYHLVLLNSELL